mgnify:CR=1 FL=1
MHIVITITSAPVSCRSTRLRIDQRGTPLLLSLLVDMERLLRYMAVCETGAILEWSTGIPAHLVMNRLPEPGEAPPLDPPAGDPLLLPIAGTELYFPRDGAPPGMSGISSSSESSSTTD